MTDLRTLVAHDTQESADTEIQHVHARFEEVKRDFLALQQENHVIGLCSREELGELLGTRYGWSLYHRKPVGRQLLRPATLATPLTPVPEVLAQAFNRKDRHVYDDVVLVEPDGQLIGLIPTVALMRLQHEMFRTQIHMLEAQRTSLRENNLRMREELVMARELQLSLLPDTDPEVTSVPPLRFGYRLEAAGEVSGDFLQVLNPGKGRLGVLLCDVMGHGVRSALVTAMIRALSAQLLEVHHDPGCLLTRMNRHLAPVLNQGDTPLFVTAVCLLVDLEKGEVRFSTAGHHPPHPHPSSPDPGSALAGL